MIEPLYLYTSSTNGIDCTMLPTTRDLINKINEIIDKLNKLEQNHINDSTNKEVSGGTIDEV